MQPVREIPTGQILRKRSLRRAGIKTKVNHVTSEEYARMNPASAKRPAYSILEDFMLKLTTDYRMADWHDALDVYMKEMGY